MGAARVSIFDVKPEDPWRDYLALDRGFSFKPGALVDKIRGIAQSAGVDPSELNLKELRFNGSTSFRAPRGLLNRISCELQDPAGDLMLEIAEMSPSRFFK